MMDGPANDTTASAGWRGNPGAPEASTVATSTTVAEPAGLLAVTAISTPERGWSVGMLRTPV